MELRTQTPKNPENWLYRDLSEENRVFSKKVYLGKNDTEWDECTDKEKEAWEAAHPIEELNELVSRSTTPN